MCETSLPSAQAALSDNGERNENTFVDDAEVGYWQTNSQFTA